MDPQPESTGSSATPVFYGASVKRGHGHGHGHGEAR